MRRIVSVGVVVCARWEIGVGGGWVGQCTQVFGFHTGGVGDSIGSFVGFAGQTSNIKRAVFLLLTHREIE